MALSTMSFVSSVAISVGLLGTARPSCATAPCARANIPWRGPALQRTGRALPPRRAAGPDAVGITRMVQVEDVAARRHARRRGRAGVVVCIRCGYQVWLLTRRALPVAHRSPNSSARLFSFCLVITLPVLGLAIPRGASRTGAVLDTQPHSSRRARSRLGARARTPRHHPSLPGDVAVSARCPTPVSPGWGEPPLCVSTSCQAWWPTLARQTAISAASRLQAPLTAQPRQANHVNKTIIY